MALLVVLWACTLLVIVLGGAATIARVEVVQTHALVSRTQARYAALAGIERAAYSMRIADPMRQWVADGRTYDIELDQAHVRVEVLDEDGKINLNNAGLPLLRQLMFDVGLPPARCDVLLASIQRWRSIPGSPAATTSAPTPPSSGGFASIEELETLPGMDHETYLRLEPALTLWSYRSTPNPAHAQALALAASTNLALNQVADYVAKRQASPMLDQLLPQLPGGQPVWGSKGGTTLSISSQATLADDTRVRLRATVMLQDKPGDPHAYRILRWQEDVGG